MNWLCQHPDVADGITPLMLAAGGHHAETVALLPERGADPTLRDSEGKRARDYALAKAERSQTVRAKVESLQPQGTLPEELRDSFSRLSESAQKDLEEQVTSVRTSLKVAFGQMSAQSNQARDATLELLSQ